ncbi:MAG: hypothetical protein AB1792_06795 [Candidatus Zixiibacteriota bacterium]
MTGKIIRTGIVLALAAAIGGVAAWAADSPQTVEKMIKQRRMKQLMNTERYRMTPNVRWGYRVDGGTNPFAAGSGMSIVNDNGYAVNPMFQAAGVPPPDPVGSLAVGNTSYDYQHNSTMHHEVGRWATGTIVHFTWMFWDKVPPDIEDADRFVSYSSYTIGGGFNQPYNGVTISLGVFARGGYCGGEPDGDNAWHASFHQKAEAGSPYSSWHLYFPTPGSALHIDDELTSTPVFGEVLWPVVGIQENGAGTDIYHSVSHGANEDPRDRIVYWRFDGTNWIGPVAIDSNGRLAYVVAADPNSQKVAIGMCTDREFSSGNLNIAYYESQTEGAGWISGTELGPANKNIITNYNSPTGPQAWGHTSVRYDLSGYLHFVWDEQRVANESYDIAIRHWSDSAFQIRPVALGYWENLHSTGAFNLHLAKVTMGIGDGGTLCQGGAWSNKNYVYVVYTQLGGSDPTSQADASAADYYNGELYLSVSNSGGRTWAPPVNITNTKTPGCNPGATPAGQTNPPRPDEVCRSEHWATIGPYVHDIDVSFIEDNDAGGIPQGEGTWQINRFMYLRFPGGTTDAPNVCPVIAANYAGFITAIPECEYHADRGATNVETFTLINLGNATMTGNISKVLGASWLTLGTSGPYTINAGDPDIIFSVTMSAVGITTQGLYQDTIRITHDAPNVASPQNYPIDFFVVDDFFCPQDDNLKTGVYTAVKAPGDHIGSLELDVRTNARFGSQDDEGGLWRWGDSSTTIFDASLLVAHGPQPVGDTVVYHRFFDRNDPGQFGYRAQGDLFIDTAKYTTDGGFAMACGRMTTSDSLVGVVMEWYFPQDADSDEFVLARYSFYSYAVEPSGAHAQLPDVVAGLLGDLDVVPASRYGTVQSGVENQNGGDLLKGLVWQQGQDTAGHVPPNPLYTAERYRGGVEFIAPGTLIGAQVGNNVQDIQPGGGPKSEWLYRTLVSLSGINTPALPDTDMYTIMTIAKGQELGNSRKAYKVVVAFVSDTVDEASFKTTADKAKDYAGKIGLTGATTKVGLYNRPPHANPQWDDVISVQDVVKTVDVAFRGVAATKDPCCTYARTDVNCDLVTSVTDVVKVVNVAFRGGADYGTGGNFCDPCPF